MKQLILTIIFIVSFVEGVCAQKAMPKNINDDFAYYIITNYKYGNGNTRLFIMEKLRMKGYSAMDIDALVESIGKNVNNRNIVLQVFHEYFGNDKEYLYANLLSIGMSASSARYITNYVVGEEYKGKNTKPKDEEILPPKVEEDNKIALKYPNYLNVLDSYSPELNFVCQEQGYSDCLTDSSELVKKLAEIRINHYKNKDNDDYLKFYSSEIAKKKKRTWEKDAVAIDSYIFKIVELYESAMKECGYDEYEWFKKLPKDLYKHYNISKAEILKNIKN